jgi:periplasmic protein TonB
MRCLAVLTLLLFLAGFQSIARVQSQLPSSVGASAKKDSKPSPDASGNYRVGNGVSAPTLVFAPGPEYPDKARRKKLDGTIVVSLTVDTTGRPKDVRISRSLAVQVSKKLQSAALSLDESAIKAVEDYRFKPAVFEGEPVCVRIQVEVAYRLY